MERCLPFPRYLELRWKRLKKRLHKLLRKQKKVEDEELPECVIPGVLSFLEVGDICRCACLSKAWASWAHSGPIATRVRDERPRGISRKIRDHRLAKLLDKGIMARCTDWRFDGFTPLHFSVTGDYRQLVDALLACGVPVDVKDKCCQTPLHLAAQLGYDHLVQVLLYKGADIEARTRNRSTALMMASQYGHQGVVKVLLQQGAELDVKDEHNDTSLITAAAWGHQMVVEALISAGAKLDEKGLHGRTALSWAKRQGYCDIAQLLIQAGADQHPLEEICMC